MHAVISKPLRHYLDQHGKSALTLTLKTLYCLCETTLRVSIETATPHDPTQYASFLQDGIRIYYSPRFSHASDVLEFDIVRVRFQNRPSLVGPERLLAQLILGRIEEPALTLATQRLNIH